MKNRSVKQSKNVNRVSVNDYVNLQAKMSVVGFIPKYKIHPDVPIEIYMSPECMDLARSMLSGDALSLSRLDICEYWLAGLKPVGGC